jgi:hypothetical protein
MRSDAFKIFFCILLAGVTFVLNPSVEYKKESKVLPPPEGVEYFHFGFKESMADLFWLSFIQHSFDCSKYKDPNGELCPYRWGYRTLDAASVLSPKFEVLYVHGAVKLTVLLEDHEGASVLFDRGLEHIKGSWLIPYRAAYLQMIELENHEKAATLLERAAQNGAPYWTRSLAARMYQKSGRLELSFRVLKELYDEASEGPWKEGLENRLAGLNKKIRQVN